MYYVYALVSENKRRIYVGITKNLDERIKEHNLGKTKSTRYYRPWRLFYYEKLTTRLEARKKEIKLKSGSGKEFLRKILKTQCPCSSTG